MQDLKIIAPLPISIQSDSQAAIAVAKNPTLHEKMKHVELDLHFVRDSVTEGFVSVSHVPARLQLADLLTKAKSFSYMAPFLKKMNVMTIPGTISARGGMINI